MKRLLNSRLYFTTLVATILLFAVAPCLAKKGGNGNGGGRPGGGEEEPPPPTLPVIYNVTPTTIPDSSAVVYGHNEAAAMVGSLHAVAVGDRRALAYLPEFSPEAFLLDDHPKLTGKPGWHMRSAADINNNGTIVGNLHPSGDPETMRSYIVTGAATANPVLHELPLINPTAQQEAAVAINDSGDVVVWSQELAADGSPAQSLYVGNPGLEGSPASPFVAVDFTGQGFANTWIDNSSLSITERRTDGTFSVGGALQYEGQSSFAEPFRLSSSDFTVETGRSYVQDDGSELEWYGATTSLDMNNNGDVVGNAIIRPAKQGKLKNNFFSAIWSADSGEFVSALGEDRFQTDYAWGATNNDDDYLVSSPDGGAFDTLWHSHWSSDNGPIAIADLIDPNDPYRNTFDFDAPWELTGHDASGWPTILGQETRTLADGSTQDYWLILTPQLTSGLLNVTGVPEPATGSVLVIGIALIATVRCRSRFRYMRNGGPDRVK